MSTHDMIKIAVKLLGLALLLYGLTLAASFVPMLLAAWVRGQVDTPVLPYMGWVAIPIIAGLFFWLVPSPVAGTIVKEDLSNVPASQWLPGIERIGIRILGLFLLYHGLVDLVSQTFSYRQAKATMPAEGVLNTAGFFVAGAEIVLALALVFGAAGISGFIRWLRSAG